MTGLTCGKCGQGSLRLRKFLKEFVGGVDTKELEPQWRAMSEEEREAAEAEIAKIQEAQDPPQDLPPAA